MHYVSQTKSCSSKAVLKNYQNSKDCNFWCLTNLIRKLPSFKTNTCNVKVICKKYLCQYSKIEAQTELTVNCVLISACLEVEVVSISLIYYLTLFNIINVCLAFNSFVTLILVIVFSQRSVQKQSSRAVLRKRCSANLLKSHFGMGIPL